MSERSDSGSPELDLDTPSVSEKPKPPPKKKRRIRRRQKKEDDEEYAENKNMASSFSNKFKGKKREDHVPVFEVRKGTGSVKNSENYESSVRRAVDTHLNKLFQWEDRHDTIEGAYLCALCHEGVHQNKNGELFGPYYADISVGKFWPTFLAKRPTTKKTTTLELWFHGECVLWAPDVHMAGNQLTNLDCKMEVFWSQHCEVCGKTGASIKPRSRNNEFLHYECAKRKGYTLNEHSLTC